MCRPQRTPSIRSVHRLHTCRGCQQLVIRLCDPFVMMYYGRVELRVSRSEIKPEAAAKSVDMLLRLHLVPCYKCPTHSTLLYNQSINQSINYSENYWECTETKGLLLLDRTPTHRTAGGCAAAITHAHTNRPCHCQRKWHTVFVLRMWLLDGKTGHLGVVR